MRRGNEWGEGSTLERWVSWGYVGPALTWELKEPAKVLIHKCF